MPDHGTWKQTGGGGPDLSGLLGGAVLVGVAIGVAVIIEAIMWWLIGGAVVAAAGWVWVRQREAAAATARTLAVAREHERRELLAARDKADQRQHERDLAEITGRTQAHASTALMAPLVAALIGTARPAEPYPEPEPVRVRAEVVRRG